jgi:hypothetical protein
VFYRTPAPESVKSWREQTGNDFVFSWKASKFITHWKRLAPNSVNSLALLEDRLTLLGDKAGPILFQLPPRFEADADRLKAFFKLLCSSRRYCFEFRHPSWYAPAILRLLTQHNVCLCISDHHDAPAPWRRTADFVYIRGHGPRGRYRGATATACWQIGRRGSGPGRSRAAMSSSISTTIRKARLPPTRSSCGYFCSRKRAGDRERSHRFLISSKSRNRRFQSSFRQVHDRYLRQAFPVALDGRRGRAGRTAAG